jgi:hypothetical protein
MLERAMGAEILAPPIGIGASVQQRRNAARCVIKRVTTRGRWPADSILPRILPEP